MKKLKITEDTRFVARYEKEETDKFVVSFDDRDRKSVV